MDISIVIPAFNEEKKIGFDVQVAAVFIDDEALLGEIIVVDDGSTDNTAEEAQNATLPSAVERNIIRFAYWQFIGLVKSRHIVFWRCRISLWCRRNRLARYLVSTLC